jgi:type 1 fimbria pilin
MVTRCLTMFAAALILAVFVSQQAPAADDQVHEATVVMAGDGKITLTFKGDEKKHTHDVAKDAKITLDGKDAKLDDLKEGATVKATMDDKFVVHKIEAKSKAK